MTIKPPLIKGGQGRSEREVMSTGEVLLLLISIFIIGISLGVFFSCVELA
jgi:hypothetical protein